MSLSRTGHRRFARRVSQEAWSISSATAVSNPAASKPKSIPPAPVYRLTRRSGGLDFRVIHFFHVFPVHRVHDVRNALGNNPISHGRPWCHLRLDADVDIHLSAGAGAPGAKADSRCPLRVRVENPERLPCRNYLERIRSDDLFDGAPVLADCRENEVVFAISEVRARTLVEHLPNGRLVRT